MLMSYLDKASLKVVGTRPIRPDGVEKVIGQDVPDESKERHTEIAVDAGKKMGDRHADKH